jgi:hypothetical protein
MLEYKIIKELGYGMIGTVYLIETSEKNYALKIENVLDTDLIKSSESRVWRELDFCLNFANKYPNHFTKLIDYEFKKDCKHRQKYTFDLRDFDQDKQDYLVKLKKSNYCVYKIFELIDTTLDKMIEYLSVNQIYSMIIQLTYISYLLHSNNYVHGDFQTSNIGMIATKDKFIKIFDYDVPTFGYIYKIIDYGVILNKKDIKSNEEDQIFNNLINNELKNIKNNFIDMDFFYMKYWIYVNNKRIDKNVEENYQKMLLNSNYNKIKNISDNKYEQLFYYYVLNNKTRIPKEDIIFFIKANNDYNKIIDYFYKKLIKKNKKKYNMLFVFILIIIIIIILSNI